LFGEETDDKAIAQIASVTKEKVEPKVNEPSNALITKTVAVAPAIKPEPASFQKSEKKVAAIKKTSPEKKTRSAE
jgi:tRNA-binding EMAP/Myf-like protein